MPIVFLSCLATASETIRTQQLHTFTETRIASEDVRWINVDRDWHREATTAIENISRLVDGWDGEESIAPKANVILRAKQTVHLVYTANLSAHRILATRDGGIGIYCFESGARAGRGAKYFRVGLEADGRTEFESGELGAPVVETVTLAAEDIDTLERHIEDWVTKRQSNAVAL